MAHLAPREIAAQSLTAEGFLREIVEPCRPAILRGLVSAWPAVEAGRSPAAGLDPLDPPVNASVFVDRGLHRPIATGGAATSIDARRRRGSRG